MRDRFWSMYTEKRFEYSYYWYYRDLSQKIDFWLKVIATFTTGTGLACLLLERNAPVIWTTLLVISQTYQAIQHLLPFQERIVKVNYFLPPLQKLINDIANDWEYIDNYSDDKITELIHKYQNAYYELTEQFISSYPFPQRKYCKKKATEEMKNYISYHYFPEEVNKHE